jgi:predicted transglutaminase-like protease
MYWLTRMDYLCGGFVAMIAIGVVVFIVLLLIITCAAQSNVSCSEKDEKEFISFCKGMAIIGTVLLIIGGVGRVMTPTTNEYAAIVLIPKIINNEKLPDDSKELYDLAVEWTKQQLKSGLPQKPQTPQAEKVIPKI